MCGICGFFYRNVDRPISSIILDRMVDTMTHRGPDGRGTFMAKGGALGHRRLTIIDLMGGQQPFTLPNERAVLVTNGEIYNYLELKKTYLKDVALNSTSDTEVLLHMIRKRGMDAIRLLNGMFAFAYWDIENRRVIFGRDPVGQKPLFYYFGPQSFVFASELSSMVQHPDVPREIDVAAFKQYLLYEGFPHPMSPLKDVRKLSPGHHLILDLANWSIREDRYWTNFPETDHPTHLNESDYIEDFEQRFIEAVERHLRSDVEVGIYLSGGLDSPSIVKAVSHLREIGSVKTFTIKHELDSFDEAASAKQVADYFGTHHHERAIGNEAFLADIDPLLANTDEPIADPGFLALYQVAKFSQEHVKVILSGNGGDEFYAGYHPFKALSAYRIANNLLPEPVINYLYRLSKLFPVSHDYMNLPFKIQRFLRGVASPPAEVLMQWIGSFNHTEIESVVNRDIFMNQPSQEKSPNSIQLYDALRQNDRLLEQPGVFLSVLHTFQQVYLPVCICNHADKASMRVSQELRSPFLDTELMRFANQMPSRLKYHRGKTKYVLRKYHEQNSPAGVSKRPKQGFTVPIASFLTDALKSWADDILDPVQIEQDGFFNQREVRRLWDEHQARKANHAKQLWTIIVFQHWLHSVWKNWTTVQES